MLCPSSALRAGIEAVDIHSTRRRRNLERSLQLKPSNTIGTECEGWSQKFILAYVNKDTLTTPLLTCNANIHLQTLIAIGSVTSNLHCEIHCHTPHHNADD